MRSKGAFSPRSFSGFKEYSGLDHWELGASYQVDSGVPAAASSWGTIQVVNPGHFGTWLVLNIPGGPPAATFVVDSLEAVLFDVTDYEALVLSSTYGVNAFNITSNLTTSGALSASISSGSIVTDGVYTFTGVDGTTHVEGPSTTVVIPITSTLAIGGTLAVPNITGAGATTYPSAERQTVGVTSSIRDVTASIYSVVNPLNPVDAATTGMLDHVFDSYLLPRHNESFTGRSWSVSMPRSNEFDPVVIQGRALGVTFSNSIQSTFPISVLPFLRVLGRYL